MEQAVADFNSASRMFGDYASRLNMVGSALNAESKFTGINRSIRSRVNAVNEAANAVARSGKSLDSIRLEYINSERALHQKLGIKHTFNLGRIVPVAGVAAAKGFKILPKIIVPWKSLIKPKIKVGPVIALLKWPTINWGFFAPFIDWIKNIFKPKPKPEPPKPDPMENYPPNWKFYTREEERANDHRMKNETQELMRKALAKWDRASIEERKVILNELFRDVQKIMGTNLDPEIRFPSLGGGTRGYHNYSMNLIGINADMLGRANSSQLLKTVVHEVRHSYQYDVVNFKNNHVVSEETRQQWASNLPPPDSNYYRGPDHSRYLTQPVEWDCKNFAGQQNELVGLTPQYGGSW